MTEPNEASPRRATEGIAENTGERSLTSLPLPGSTREDATQSRCARCGHPIAAPDSLRTGYGRECRRMLDGDPLEAVRHG